jgi:two-component system alkaline phosphatase synthesis response regulator PhoP
MGIEIIIVDDDPLAGTLMNDVMTEAGFKTLLVNDSLKALPTIKAEKPRLTILDILMPGIDGLTLCKMIKEDPETKDTRVIIVSGKAFQPDMDRAQRLGAELFITKPYDTNTVTTMIVNLIGPPGASPS